MTSPTVGKVVIVDTDVWSRVFLPGTKIDPRTTRWQDALTGVTVAIAAQTRAELLGGFRASTWGEQRVVRSMRILDATPVIYPDERVVQAMADLYAACRRAGHALHMKEHTADRWIAATAIAMRASLLSADGIYAEAPGVTLHQAHMS